jgi:hypothetical protein
MDKPAKPLTDIRELLVVKQVLCWPAEVLAVQGHQEECETHDVKHLVEDVGEPA